MILLLLPALAADRLAERLGSETQGGFGEISDLVSTEDGAWVGFPDGAGNFHVLSTATWNVADVAACSGTRGAAVRTDSDDIHWFYTGCSDGSVAVIRVSGSSISLNGTLALGETAIKAVETDGTLVYGIYGEDSLSAKAVNLQGEVQEGWPVILGINQLEDTVLSDTILVALAGDGRFERLDISSKATATILSDLSTLRFADAWDLGSGVVYLADHAGTVGYVNSANLATYQGSLRVGNDATAVAVGSDRAYISVDDQSCRYTVSGTIIGEEEVCIPEAGNIEEYALIDGYSIGATEVGELLVFTDRPWVEVLDVSPTATADGDSFTLKFTADQAADWELRLGGDQSGNGTLLDDGSLEAGAEVERSYTVDDRYAEGSNHLWVFVGQGTRIGHDVGLVSVNNPPGAVDLSLGFGNQSVSVQFPTLPDEDIANYQIYLTTTPFSAEDWPTGGPEFDGPDKGVDLDPLTPGTGSRITHTIYPLTNNTTYYVAVRATDVTGLEGPMSEVKSATPQESFGAAELAGDEGGFCGTAMAPSMGLGLLGGLAVALRRRRALVLGLGLLVVPGLAEAKPRDKESPKSSTVALRYGPVTINDETMADIYGTSDHEMLRFEYGLTSNFIEGTFGLGFYQELGFKLTGDGDATDEHVMMTIWPMNIDVVGRLDILREQPLVPFARVGVDAWLWNENWGSKLPDSTVPAEHVGGGKFGWHYGFGGMILLDSLDRKTADRVEANTGINDTFLVGEYRSTQMFSKTGLDLGSTEISIGLKLDF